MKFRALQWDYHAEAILVERTIEQQRRLRSAQESGKVTTHLQEVDDNSVGEPKEEKISLPKKNDTDDGDIDTGMGRETETPQSARTKMVSKPFFVPHNSHIVVLIYIAALLPLGTVSIFPRSGREP